MRLGEVELREPVLTQGMPDGAAPRQRVGEERGARVQQARLDESREQVERRPREPRIEAVEGGVLQDAVDTTGILDAIEQSEGRAALFPGAASVSEQGERLGHEGVHERLVLGVAERDEPVTGEAVPVERAGQVTLRHGDQALEPAGPREQEEVRPGLGGGVESRELGARRIELRGVEALEDDALGGHRRVGTAPLGQEAMCLSKALAPATLRLVAPSCLGEEPIAERLRARRIATGDGHGRLERDRRVAREGVARAAPQGAADDRGLLGEHAGVAAGAAAPRPTRGAAPRRSTRGRSRVPLRSGVRGSTTLRDACPHAGPVLLDGRASRLRAGRRGGGVPRPPRPKSSRARGSRPTPCAPRRRGGGLRARGRG